MFILYMLFSIVCLYTCISLFWIETEPSAFEYQNCTNLILKCIYISRKNQWTYFRSVLRRIPTTLISSYCSCSSSCSQPLSSSCSYFYSCPCWLIVLRHVEWFWSGHILIQPWMQDCLKEMWSFMHALCTLRARSAK